MITVTRKDGEHVEGLIRRFKKRCDRAGVLHELRSRDYYVKPSTKRQVARGKARRREYMNRRRGSV